MLKNNFKRCAACKHLRRGCAEDCILYPYFPASDEFRFLCVHKIFGASNVTIMLKKLPLHERAAAAECMALEAIYRVEYPVHGIAGVVSLLLQEILKTERELAETQSQIIAMHMQRQQLHQQGNSDACNFEHMFRGVLQFQER